jgi:hypothetical protein
LTKKEEDSQGNQKLTTEHVDYVQKFSGDEGGEEPTGSPMRFSQPGSRRTQFREKLQAQIRSQKVKEYKEKIRLAAIYNHEKVLGEKGEEEEEEKLEDDEFSTESEPELTDEEEQAVRLKNKKKAKSAFVEEEAEDEDGESVHGSDEEFDEDEEKFVKKKKGKGRKSEDEADSDSHSDEEVDQAFLSEKMLDSGTEEEPVVEKSYRRVQQMEDSSEDELEAAGGKKMELEDLSTSTTTLVKSKPREEQEEDELPDLDLDEDENDKKDSGMSNLGNSESPGYLSTQKDMFADYDDNPDPNPSSQFVETPVKTIFTTSETQITPAQREISKLMDSETPLYLQNKVSSKLIQYRKLKSMLSVV